MGINALWQLLRAEDLEEWYRGGVMEEHAALVAAVDGQAVAIDLSTWVVQADQQTALTPHFSREERCMKVAFERALQWLRHGCLPVPVVEGRPPAEKLAAQRARFEARNGYAGGGSQAGAAQFQRLGQVVGQLLEELGLPVFYAPGEAEAVCAALNRAGCVDAAASADSDTLLYGAEAVLQALKLSTTQKEECELRRVRMASIRRRLGLRRGGDKALGVLAMLAGSDYDLDGAQGVGSAGGLAVARHLLQGDADDDQVLERLAALVQRCPKQELLELTQCTGCQNCGHEGGRKGRIKRHSSRNRCSCCPHTEDGACEAVLFARCGCAFHRLETERRVERILERVRASPGFLQEAQAAMAVFERQGAEAEAYVRCRLEELGCLPGQRLRWLRRPRVQGVFDVIDARRKQMLWDMPAVRSKLLPVMLEWDLLQQADAACTGGDATGGDAARAEFRAAAIQKVHGQRSKNEALSEAHWRYVMSWERLEGDVEELGMLEFQPKKPRAGTNKGAAAAAGDEDEEGCAFPGSQALSQTSSQQRGGILSPGSGSSQVERLTVREFDLRWLKEQPAEHRAVRIAAVHRLLPQLEVAYRQQLAAGPGKGSRAAARKGGAVGGGKGSRGSVAAARAPRAKGASGGGLALQEVPARGEGAPQAAAAGAAAGQALPQEQQQQQEQQKQADITRYLAQRRPGSAAPPAAAGKAAASRPGARGYGLAAGGAGAAGAQQREALPGYQQYLPASAQSMQALLGRALGGGGGRQQQQEEVEQGTGQQRRQSRPPPEQQASPPKKLRSPRREAGAAAAGVSPGGRSIDADSDFQVLLTSPESPAEGARARSERPGWRAWGGTDCGGGADGSDEGDEDLPPLALALRMAGMAGAAGRPPREAHGSGSEENACAPQQRALPVAQQRRQGLEYQQARQPEQRVRLQGRSRSAAGGTPAADIRSFFAAGPASPSAERAVAVRAQRRPAAAAAGAQVAAPAATETAPARQAGAAADVVDLTTPLCPSRRQLAAEGWRGNSGSSAQHPVTGSGKRTSAQLPSSPIDLTLSDGD